MNEWMNAFMNEWSAVEFKGLWNDVAMVEIKVGTRVNE
jgi:hypothetical protein